MANEDFIIKDGVLTEYTGDGGDVIIPNSVTSIGQSAFADCSKMTSINIPGSVTSIAPGAFYNCTGLTSVIIPDSMMSIGYGAFQGCTGLTSVIIPDSLTRIEEAAFYGCTGLTSVMIPDSVTSIDDLAFYGCMKLTSFEYAGTKAQWIAIKKEGFWDCDTNDYVIHCTDGDIARGSSDSGSSGYDMISESDGYKCKVKEWEIEEELMLGGNYPQITVEGSYEFFPYSKTYSWEEDVVEETIGNRKIRYKRELYYACGVILKDERVIHIDGRNKPSHDDLNTKYHAKYNDDDLMVTTYTIEEIDENGNVVFSHSVDSMPDIVHDIAKDSSDTGSDDNDLPF